MPEDPPPTAPPDAQSPPASASPAPPVLGYQAPRSGKGVTVAWCADVMEAELLRNELNANGVPAASVNQHVVSALQGYVGFVRVEVQVAVEDLDRAAAVLARLPGRNDVEPAEDPPDGSADFTTDAGGARVPLAVAAEYDTAQEMLEASAALGSARIESFLPDLVPRPPRDADAAEPAPRRFRVRVVADELARARRVLEEAAEDDGDAGGDADDTRCPKCASWRVYGSSPGVVASLLRLLGGTGGPRGKTWQCLKCGHRWGQEA